MNMFVVNIGNTIGTSVGRNLTFGGLISLFLTSSIVIAGIVLLFLFLGGGLKMIQSAGSGDAKGAASGKDSITWAIVGFLIILAAYWIIRIVERIVGTQFLTNPFEVRM